MKVFNEILRIEEESLKKGEFHNLSVREMHVIEAVCTANHTAGSNRSSDVAHALRISAGTLTTTVKLLEKKGCLIRKKDTADKRIVRLYATQKGQRADRAHQKFHREMVLSVLKALPSEETDVLIKALKKLEAFFERL